MRNQVVVHYSGYCNHLQELCSPRRIFHSLLFLHQCIIWLKTPWNKRHETICLFLKSRNFHKVFCDIISSFHMTVHHGSRCWNSKTMSFFHYSKPGVTGDLFWADDLFYLIDQNFCTSTRN